MIEEQLSALTAAINRLADAMSNGQPTQAAVPVAAAPKAKAKKTEPASTPAAEPAPTAEPAPAANVETPAEQAKVITMADLREVAEKLLALKRLPDILEVNKEHGIKRITECPAEKYAAVYASLNERLTNAQPQ